MPQHSIPFTPQDHEARDAFLRRSVQAALQNLNEDTTPQWGAMTARQMVEHLIWAFDISTGDIETGCLVPEERRRAIRPFIFSDAQNRRNVAHPSLLGGLPPLRFDDLPSAITALQRSIASFLALRYGDPTIQRVHPMLGAMNLEEWSRIHYKHCYHHLMQFGLIADPAQATGP
jgi:hypothetical protein